MGILITYNYTTTNHLKLCTRQYSLTTLLNHYYQPWQVNHHQPHQLSAIIWQPSWTIINHQSTPSTIINHHEPSLSPSTWTTFWPRKIAHLPRLRRFLACGAFGLRYRERYRLTAAPRGEPPGVEPNARLRAAVVKRFPSAKEAIRINHSHVIHNLNLLTLMNLVWRDNI